MSCLALSAHLPENGWMVDDFYTIKNYLKFCITLFIWIGLFSCLIREQAQMPDDGYKWMVMDGDIDPMWIESLNTVMDDNKVRAYY